MTTRNETEDNYIWNQPSWQSRAFAWIRGELERLGVHITGEYEQFHITAWSTVVRIPARSGPVFFKASAAGELDEGAITTVLARAQTGHLPVVLAAHPLERWILLQDLGSQYRGYLRETHDLAPLEQALPVFSRLQREMIAHTAELVQLGVPERPIPAIPGYLDEILERTDILFSSDYALTEEQLHRLVQLKGRVAEMAAAVSAGGMALSVHHDDMHDANIFIKGGQIYFSDWGDCCVAHPFFSMLILLRSITDSLQTDEQDPRVLRLRDVYLDGWHEFGTPEQLLQQFNLAWRLGMINRAYSWYTGLGKMEEPYRTRYCYTVPGWLGDFLETMAV